MMQVKDFIAFLRTAFPAYQYHNGMIHKKEQQCVGVYLKGRGDPDKAIGGMENTGEALLPLSVLVHWGQDANLCEQTANGIYDFLQKAKDAVVGGFRVVCFDLQDSSPVDISRDENNVCEMVIRVNIIYERQ